MIPDFSLLAELGKRLYDYVISRGAPFYSAEFMRVHSELVRAGIDLVPEIQQLPPSRLDEGIVGLLGHLASIVKAYHKSPKVEVNANYMIPCPASNDLRDQARFTERDREANSFLCFLQLEKWADRQDACPQVVLPVERPGAGHGLLFGAPKAFVHKKTQVINDTLTINAVWSSKVTAVRSEILDFFEEQRDRVRSFASFPVVAPKGTDHSCPHPVIAVVNIDANCKRLLGSHWSHQQKLGVALEPSIHILSHLLVRKYYTSGTSNVAGSS